ncbi:hypothetical protein BOTCAL_0162g00040 [Botryotinia calthae]|uniref:Uncharacterized protein n=1 Tax=Botryotinia calthae TaxID=38488 RepID=A0A4Y8D1M6_9HELO|nr:hypothetical protein BOTCAL_0162g00040 [Botryotinia calthae]
MSRVHKPSASIDSTIMVRTNKPSTALVERSSKEDHDSILLPIYTYFAEYKDHRDKLRMRQIYWIPTICDGSQGNGVVFLSTKYKEMADRKPFAKPTEGLRTMFHIHSRNRKRLFDLIRTIYDDKNHGNENDEEHHQVVKKHLAFLDILKEQKVIEDSYETSKAYFQKEFEKECKNMREAVRNIKAAQPKAISPSQKKERKPHPVPRGKL